MSNNNWREEFIKDFGERELHGLELLEFSRTQINILIESVLFFQEYLSEEELMCLLKIKDSLFLKESIIPIDYIDEQMTETPNNQRKMAASIYDIYELIRAIEK